MIRELKQSDIRKIFPKRDQNSHKGQNGKVMIVGGSLEYYGAPVLSGLGALYSGADLVYLFVPECNFEVTRSLYPDFIVCAFPGNFLDMKGIATLVEFAQECDVALIGPGLGKRDETFEAVLQLVKKINIPTVLDADAIQVFQKIKEVPLPQKIVITPHHHELQTLTGKDITFDTALTAKMVLLRTLATDLKINILLKGAKSIAASEDGELVMNESTGNAGMTVGGSGDVLSGFIASLLAQGATAFEACQIGSYILGKAGDRLFEEKAYSFSASDLAMELPYAIRNVAF